MFLIVLILLLFSAGAAGTVYYFKDEINNMGKAVVTPVTDTPGASALSADKVAAILKSTVSLGGSCLESDNCKGYGIAIGDTTCSTAKKCETLYPNYAGSVVAQSDCIGIDPNFACV